MVLPPETKLLSPLLLDVDSGVLGHAAVTLAFAGAAEGVLSVGIQMHAALSLCQEFCVGDLVGARQVLPQPSYYSPT